MTAADVSILDRILAAKFEEVEARKAALSPQDAARRAEAAGSDPSVGPPRSLYRALRETPSVGVIAEVKRRSPSKGVLAPIENPAALAEAYVRGGAAAVSVLTDGPFFGGSGEDLVRVRAAVPVPVLRKDFIVDEYQIDEARMWGADAVLLIAAALDDDAMGRLLAKTRSLGMDALVEVHTKKELQRALALGARVVGVNNRDLRTFQTSLDVTLHLSPLVPSDTVLVSESGIRDRDDVAVLARAGADGILVGESFVTSADPEVATARLADVPRGGLRRESGVGVVTPP